MSVFEPATLIPVLKNAADVNKKKGFEKKWKSEVEKRWKGWRDSRETQSQYAAQLEWEAHVVEYVNFVYSETKLHGNSKNEHAPTLAQEIPILGPQFVPPSYLHIQKRDPTPAIGPEMTYLKPVHIVHPFFYPELAQCPQCDSEDVKWSGWSTTGHREVHGVFREETAIGLQLRCKRCEHQYGPGAAETGSYCFSTTSASFWERREHWEIPMTIPFFLKRCAVTRELFDWIVELRPSTTAAGLAENIKQLHLLEYHRQKLGYLQAFKKRRDLKNRLVPPPALRTFSRPDEVKVVGYGDKSITDDLITDIYQKFSERTRQDESQEYLRTLTAICISLDNTFRAAGKASIADSENNRTKVLKGGILSALNENGEIIGWTGGEISELLHGLKRRNMLLNVSDPSLAVIDNCCHMRSAIMKPFPDIYVMLDVWHFAMRYMICIINGTKNPHRAAVARDIIDAILKTPANKHNPAVYWDQKEQEVRLIAAYEKWDEIGSVWTAAAVKVHADQLAHVRKGCLARPRQDVRSDGSRIEGSHKGWNGLQRAHASGITVLSAMCHDFVLRRNIRVMQRSGQQSSFIQSTFGSHHIRLVDCHARLWNALLADIAPLPSGLHKLPRLLLVSSNETFGLVRTKSAVGYHNLLEVKDEPEDELIDLSAQDDLDPDQILTELNIDPALLRRPAREQHLCCDEDSAVCRHMTPQSEASCIGQQAIELPFTAVSMTSAPSLSTPSHPAARSPLLTITDAASECSPSSSGEISCDAGEAPEPRVPGEGCMIVCTKGKQEAASAAMEMQVEETAPVARTSSAVKRKATELHAESTQSEVVEVIDVEEETSGNRTKRFKLGVQGWNSTFVSGDSTNQGARARAADQSKTAVSSGIQKFFTASKSTSGSMQSTSHDIRPPTGTNSVAISVSDGHRSTTTALRLPQFTISGLTASQQLFSIATGINALSISITTDDEFYLFMDLRSEQKWVSYSMSPQQWVMAANDYNTRFEAHSRSRGRTAIRKTPRALMEKLGEIEPKVLARLASGHYTCELTQSISLIEITNETSPAAKRTKTEDFWKKHCNAVPLLKSPDGNGKKSQRKTNTCSRCKVIMWPGPEGSEINHKRSYCSDGVKQKPQKIQTVSGAQVKTVLEEPPQWPQPPGIFTGGTHFSPDIFLATLRSMYEQVVVKGEPGDERSMEYMAFAALLEKRLKVVDNPDGRRMVLFELYRSLTLKPDRPGLIVEHDGIKHLWVDFLPENISDGCAGGSGALVTHISGCSNAGGAAVVQ
ncbi:hypothetical protein BKA93DRAFT_829872 [Sparassis latifolia]